LRILYLNPGAQLGGAERVLLDSLASLRIAEPDWELHLIAGELGPLLTEAQKLGVSVECVRFSESVAQLGSFGTDVSAALAASVRALPQLVANGAALKRRIRALRPDLIHTHGFKMHLLGAWLSDCPVVWHLHDFVTSRALMAKALQRSAGRVRGAIAVSESVAHDARKVFGRNLPIRTVLNAIDLKRFARIGPAADLNAKEGVVRVGMVGTFARWKGHETFLRALAHPRVRATNTQAYIIGGPVYRTANSQWTLDELRNRARSLDLNDRVTFTGFTAKPAEAMRALDIVVHASTEREPFGLVIAEAMACGRAVIAAKSGGAEELFRDGIDAIGTEPGDVDSLAEAIENLTAFAGRREFLGRSGAQTAAQNFDRQRLGPQIAEFYRQVLAQCESFTYTAEISSAA
jgi:glycosyltransferase involved in cell wall biosynthesis